MRASQVASGTKENKENFFFCHSICRGEENSRQKVQTVTEFHNETQMASYQAEEHCVMSNHLTELL